MLHFPTLPYLKGRNIPKLWPQDLKLPEEHKEQIDNPLAVHVRIRAMMKIIEPIVIAEMEAERPVNIVHRQIRDNRRGGRSQGELRYRKIKADVEKLFPEGKYDFQEQLIKQLLRVSMKHILGHEYQMSIKKISKKENWKNVVMNVIFIAARRGGKTTGTSAGTAALANNIPSFPVVIFSGGLDSATEMCALTGANLRKICGGKNIKVTKKKVTVFHPNKEASTITPFPSGGDYDVSGFLFSCRCTPARVCVFSFTCNFKKET